MDMDENKIIYEILKVCKKVQQYQVRKMEITHNDAP